MDLAICGVFRLIVTKSKGLSPATGGCSVHVPSRCELQNGAGERGKKLTNAYK